MNAAATVSSLEMPVFPSLPSVAAIVAGTFDQPSERAVQASAKYLSPQAQDLDRKVRAVIGRATGTLSVASALLAAGDWAMNLLASPGKRLQLSLLGLEYTDQLIRYAGECMIAGPDELRRCVEPPAHDKRFAGDEWLRWPYNLLHQSFLLTEQWWAAATQGVMGVDHHHQDMVSFTARQLLDVTSPGNGLWTNPTVLRQTVEEGGWNLIRGALNFIQDAQRVAARLPPPGADHFHVGRDVAATTGNVVLRNRLIELIQYAPTTGAVCPEPVLLVPAWIMKYYILDLTPAESLVKYLVDQGHTVFCISWKNPTAEDRDLGMDDYLRLGVGAALDAVCQIVPERKVHALGYCLGGTLLATAAAAMARDRDDRLASLTLLAAQTNFSEPGELSLFIDESEVSMLEAQMADRGYLSGFQMAGAFQILRSYDLLWSRLVNHYLLGRSETVNALMAWNADATRLPARMHSEYLRGFFLHDDLAQSRYRVEGRPVSLADIELPVFLVGTLTDHVAPWRSVYKLHYLTGAEITFVLTSGGHNAGIVSAPGHPHRHYQLLTAPAGAPRLDADRWCAVAPHLEGSWWPAWHDWLRAHSGPPVNPPSVGLPGRGPIADAPGHYVLEK
ncbi:PHA/PHB synthase family protein [Paraburkholderia mimosarum]|uniref:PHA/PHB synthase family protein n=1 Tax=Paraburkholderia mimosarum TaxID=312026 RepID=UPI001EE162D6|nr:alpha/beta fold hydrolase [Paraburkholderia mimosarum]